MAPLIPASTIGNAWILIVISLTASTVQPDNGEATKRNLATSLVGVLAGKPVK